MPSLLLLTFMFIMFRKSFNDEEHLEFSHIAEDKLIGTKGVEAIVSASNVILYFHSVCEITRFYSIF